MKRALFACVLFVLCLLQGRALGDEGTWNLVKNDNGVQVYSRPVEGTDLLEFEAVTEISASINVLGVILEDVPSYPQWMANCLESSIIRELSDQSVLVYFVQSLPWPIASRDVILTASTIVEEEKGSIEVLLQSDPNATGRFHKGRVRMRRFNGRIYLESKGVNQTKVCFRIMADPAGSLPASGVNAGALNVPYRTLLGMKEMAKRKKYIDAARKYGEVRALKEG